MGVDMYKCEVCNKIRHMDNIAMCDNCDCYICVDCCPYDLIDKNDCEMIPVFKNGCTNCEKIEIEINKNDAIKKQILSLVCKRNYLKVKFFLDQI